MMTLLAPVLQEYFTAYLVTQRAVSTATIRAYRDTWRLFLAFLSKKANVPAYKLETTHVGPAQVIAFLDHLEHERGNGTATRNARLAAIKAMMAFHATRAPELLDTIARIHAIPSRSTPNRRSRSSPTRRPRRPRRPRRCWTPSPPAPGPGDETGPCSPWRSRPG
jgi:integrase/recombinase XerD